MALAKITRPSSMPAVSRPRLFRLLDGTRKKPVTWIWASPGAGKTTLVSSYLASRKIQALWYQIDEGDDDIASFFYYLGQAAPKRKRALPLFTPEYRQGLSIFTRNFFRELYNRLKPPFVLVFDNYQVASSGSQLHDVMKGALEEQPQGGRLIFISRAEPPARFAYLQAKRAIELVDFSQLKFMRGEVLSLVKRLAPGRWTKAVIDQLHDTSDGWVAGVVLLMEQLKKDGETEFAKTKGSSQVMFNYFATEIFKRTDVDTIGVLLQTAFLPRATASVAQKLTGHTRAGEILSDLNRQNYFTNKRPGTEPTYEYHPLFRDFLLAQAHQVYGANQLAEIRRKAARIIEAEGQIEGAAALLRDAADDEGLAALICRNAPTVLAQGRGQTVEEWLGEIPEAMIERDPWLLYWRGMCRFAWRHGDCQRDLERAFATFREQRDGAGIFLAWSGLIMSYQSEGNTAFIDRWIALADELVREVPNFPSEEVEARVAAAMLSAIVSRQPGHPDGTYWAERALKLTRQHQDLSFRAITAFTWFHYYYRLGDCGKAAVVADEMRSLLSARNISPIAKVNASMTVVLHEFSCVLPSYRRTVTEMLDLVRTTGIWQAAKQVTLSVGIRAALSDGDLETANVWIQEMEKDLNALGPGQKAWYFIFIIRTALLRGDLRRAAAQQPEMLRLSLAGGAPLTCVEARLVSAEVLGCRGEEEEARMHLDNVLEVARDARSPYFEFMARLTEAHLYFHNGEEAEGLTALSRAMALGKAGGFVNSFVWQPAVMAQLCARALGAGIEVEYVQSLIRKRRLVPQESPVEIETWPWPVKIYTLGRFEVLLDDQPLQFAGKVQRKPLALLKTVIAFGGRDVREESLIDTLWPDTEGDAAGFALTSAIHRLRRLLGHEKAIVRKDNEVSLDNRYCWVDVWAVERLLTRAEASRGVEGDRIWTEAIRAVERGAELYRGPFLGGDAEAPWAAPLTDRLRRRMLRQIVHAGEHSEQSERWQQAADYYEKAITVDSCAEDVCRRLMIAYYRLGRPAEILATYRHCREALTSRLGTTPSAETDALLKRLRAG